MPKTAAWAMSPGTSSHAGCASTPTAHDRNGNGHVHDGQTVQEADMTTVSAHRLATIFVEVADTLVDDFDLIEFLQLVADRAAGLVGAAAVGLLLADQNGRLEFM